MSFENDEDGTIKSLLGARMGRGLAEPRRAWPQPEWDADQQYGGVWDEKDAWGG